MGCDPATFGLPGVQSTSGLQLLLKKIHILLFSFVSSKESEADAVCCLSSTTEEDKEKRKLLKQTFLFLFLLLRNWFQKVVNLLFATKKERLFQTKLRLS